MLLVDCKVCPLFIFKDSEMYFVFKILINLRSYVLKHFVISRVALIPEIYLNSIEYILESLDNKTW